MASTSLIGGGLEGGGSAGEAASLAEGVGVLDALAAGSGAGADASGIGSALAEVLAEALAAGVPVSLGLEVSVITRRGLTSTTVTVASRKQGAARGRDAARETPEGPSTPVGDDRDHVEGPLDPGWR